MQDLKDSFEEFGSAERQAFATTNFQSVLEHYKQSMIEDHEIVFFANYFKSLKNEDRIKLWSQIAATETDVVMFNLKKLHKFIHKDLLGAFKILEE